MRPDPAAAAAALALVPREAVQGTVTALGGLTVTLAGFGPLAAIGDRVRIDLPRAAPLLAEIAAFRDGMAEAIALGPLHGLSAGARAVLAPRPALSVSEAWLGRVLDPMGRPMDGRPQPAPGPAPRPTHAPAPEAGGRARLGPRMALGVRALDLFTPVRRGQRLGLFAASGVGKSTLMAMLAGGVAADVIVFALVGERGRELREFLEDDLGPERLARSVVICATSDTAAPVRREAAYAAMTVAEHFRDQGRQVLLLMDSVTRFALALREIGLAVREPPATRGYPPSVFTELPRLLERAGPGPEGCGGAITALFTVLVEGDDHDEPVADAVRGILDGHVVLDRRIAEAGRYPPVDVLRSLSRTAPGVLDAHERPLVAEARRHLATWAEVRDLVRLGAYRPGHDREADAAVALAPAIERVLAQPKGMASDPDEAFSALASAMSMPDSP
ncbi:FliI/YscN family ATPase [Neoroseomonas oryzicola]|uniref:FliI/YscN family ATPase n=3 Tax=Neoroseomonas oryzicola TaxID=535904 RepID=A0ABX1ENG6_9PROT|nr:FliI/YscN family ATPase [Neoroseomonas oryzicola]NKE19358.1 FliI/YscN family ATPase [Neoroseomonas oryzicola]